MSMIAPEYMIMAIIEKHITALARRIDVMAIVRPNAVTPFCPHSIDLRLSIIAAKVLIFMPPPIDCDEQPIHISTIAIKKVIPSHCDGPAVEKPAVLTVAEQKIDCTTRFPVDNPSIEWLYSKR